MLRDRLRKLAGNIDELEDRDQQAVDRAREITALRRKAAVELHVLCVELVADLNALLARVKVELVPETYDPDNLRGEGINLFQINVRGRIVQFEFSLTPELVSTEDFRIPYTLHGSVRCFNQTLLEQDLIQEQSIFYCLEKERHFWRYFDERTYRTGPVDKEYLVSLLEDLV